MHSINPHLPDTWHEFPGAEYTSHNNNIDVAPPPNVSGTIQNVLPAVGDRSLGI